MTASAEAGSVALPFQPRLVARRVAVAIVAQSPRGLAGLW